MVVVAYDQDDYGYEAKYDLNIIDVKTISNEQKSFGIIYDGKNAKSVKKAISIIKQSLDPKIYCKPIILLTDMHSNEMPDYVSKAVDSIIPVKNLKQSPKTQTLITSINQKIDSIILENEQKDTNIMLRVLRYAYCKNIKFYPIKNIKNKFGYSYYSISDLFDEEESLPTVILKALDERGLLESTYVDKAHSCPECSSVFINFKEVCPSCLSSNILMEDLIHHYVCANLTPESTYKENSSELTCPKCMKELKRIGVDFDKPSVMFKCKKCEKEFQDPNVLGECFNCSEKFPSESLNVTEFREYELNTVGKNAAIYGMENLILEMLNSEQNVMDTHTFKKCIGLERLRIQRYKLSNSTLAILKIAEGDKALLRLKNFDTLKEIAKEMKIMLRTTDVLTSLSDMTFGILMTETGKEGSELALNRLVDNINDLLASNVEGISKQTVYKVISVSQMTEEDIEKIWEDVNV